MARYRAREESYYGDQIFEKGEIAQIPDDVEVGPNWEAVDKKTPANPEPHNESPPNPPVQPAAPTKTPEPPRK
jgi:hypothetical protein